MKPEDLLPLKSFDELMNDTRDRLRSRRFRITNWRPGGVFHTLVAIANQGLADLYALLRDVAGQMYLATATGFWLDARAAEYECYRLEAQKTLGQVVFGRHEAGTNVVIPAGTIVATRTDRRGERLQFFVREQTVLEEDRLEVLVPVIAEFAGAKFNVGSGQITEIITPVAGIDYVTNNAGWITREGSDEEDDESLRARAMGRWNELAIGPGDAAYRNMAAQVPGVATVQIDSHHPRGQGTVDVIISGTSGMPTPALIQEVQAVIDENKALCADVLVVAPEPVEVDWDVLIYAHRDYGDLQEIQAEAAAVVDNIIARASAPYGIIRAQALAGMMQIEHVVNVAIRQPADDVPISRRQLAVRGTVNIEVTRAG